MKIVLGGIRITAKEYLIMRNVKIISKLFIIICLLNCNNSHNKKSIKSEEAPLYVEINLDNYGQKLIAFDSINKVIDTSFWNNHFNDSIIYLKVNLANFSKKPVIIKIKLLATKIPLLIDYQKINKPYKSKNCSEFVSLKFVQKNNVIYIDSMIYKISLNTRYPHLEKAYEIGYQKNGDISFCELPIYISLDTIDISNYKR